MAIEFFIPWVVKPKQSFRMGKGGRGFPVPKASRNADALTVLAAQYRPDKPLEGPLQLDIVLRYPWRKSEKKRNIALGELAKDTRPDWDNLAKQVCDVLESGGFFLDDAQIADARVRKVWRDGPSGVEIRIREVIPGKQGE